MSNQQFRRPVGAPGASPALDETCSRPRRGVALRLLACVVCVLMAAVSVAAAQQPQPRDARTMRQLGDDLYARGRFEDARDAYLQVAGQYINDAEFNRNLGWCYAKMHKPDLALAVRYWERSVQIKESDPLTLEIARAYVRMGRWPAADRLIRPLTAKHPEHVEHWLDLGELAQQAGRYDEAVAGYRAYLERRPGGSLARLNLALVLSWQKKFLEALTEYNIVLQSDPQNIDARVGEARVLAWQGQYAASLKEYDQVLARQPRNREALKGKAFAILWDGKTAEAKALFLQAQRLAPRDPEIRSALQDIAKTEAAREAAAKSAAGAAQGTAAAQRAGQSNPAAELARKADEAQARNDPAAAVAALEEARRLAPADRPLQHRLAFAYADAKRYDDALALLNEIYRQNPAEPNTLRDIAAVNARAGQLSQAADSLMAYLRVRPAESAVRLECARYLSWSRRFDEANAMLAQLLSDNANNVDARVTQAQIHAWQGHYTAALKIFDSILETHPAQREALIGRAQCLYWTGKTQEGMAAIEQLHARLPDDREVAGIADSFRDTERRRQREAASTPEDVDAAIRDLEAKLVAKADDFDTLHNLGDLYSRKPDFSRAAVFYRRAADVRPADHAVMLQLARVLSWERAYADSVQVYRTLTYRDPNPQYQLEMGRVLSWSGRHAEAIDTFDKLLQADANNMDARLELARVQSYVRRFDESLANYEIYLKANPGNREAQLENARVYAWKGDLKHADALLAVLQTQYPEDHDVLLTHGQVLQWRGRSRQAIVILNALHERFPKDKDVDISLAAAKLGLGRSSEAIQALDEVQAVDPVNPDLKILRRAAMNQVRPLLVLSFNPSFSSDDLSIYNYSSTLYFTPVQRVRSYVRASIIPAMTPYNGISQGREVAIGFSARAADWATIRGEAGGNSGSSYGDHQSAIWMGGFHLTPRSQLQLDFDVSRRFLNYLPAAVQNNISLLQYRTAVDYRPVPRLLFHGDYFHGRYSDTNRSNGGNFISNVAVYQSEKLTLETGYLYANTAFAQRTNNGYFAPTEFVRHAGMANLYGRFNNWMGYNVSGTAGGEESFHQNFRPDGTIRGSLDFNPVDRFRMSVGYAYFKLASLAFAGAYQTHSVFVTLEIPF